MSRKTLDATNNYSIKNTHPFNGPFSGTTREGRYQKGKTNLDFTEARDSEWQWHQLGQLQVCTSLQTDNQASTSPLGLFYRPDALPVEQPNSIKALKARTNTASLVLDRVRHFRPIPIHRFFAVNGIRYRYDTDFLIRFKSGRGAA